MAAGPLTSRSPCASPIVPLIGACALERLLERSGYRRLEPSRLGDRAREISIWEGRNLFVILLPSRLVVGPLGPPDWRIRANLDTLDPDLLRLIRADSAESPPLGEDVPDSGAWPVR